MEEIRLLLTEEEEELNRFLERCYGHGRDFFPRNYPQLVPQATECSLILKVREDRRACWCISFRVEGRS